MNVRQFYVSPMCKGILGSKMNKQFLNIKLQANYQNFHIFTKILVLKVQLLGIGRPTASIL